MIRYLNADISFCELDGQLFFLDIRNDRYFQLSEALERRFLSYLEAPDNTDTDVSELIKYGLLLRTMPEEYTTTQIALPDQSILETPGSSGVVSFNVVRNVFLIVATMRWQLKTRPLKTILQALIDYRRIRASPPVEGKVGSRQRLTKAATAFNRVRPYVPIATCCLIDSLSMIRFLAKRGLYANLVMGIARDPFSAHAWVQCGTLILNETVGAAQTYVPIRVI